MLFCCYVVIQRAEAGEAKDRAFPVGAGVLDGPLAAENGTFGASGTPPPTAGSLVSWRLVPRAGGQWPPLRGDGGGRGAWQGGFGGLIARATGAAAGIQRADSPRYGCRCGDSAG